MARLHTGRRYASETKGDHPLRIVRAPDSFKECLSSAAVADAIERGVLRVFPDAEVVKVPMADGGEGTVEAIAAATGASLHACRVSALCG